MFDFYMVYNGYMNNDNGIEQGLEGHYDFKAIRSNEEGLTINGKIVGQDPSKFDRSELYKKNFEKMGNSIENIKIIENFI